MTNNYLFIASMILEVAVLALFLGRDWLKRYVPESDEALNAVEFDKYLGVAAAIVGLAGVAVAFLSGGVGIVASALLLLVLFAGVFVFIRWGRQCVIVVECQRDRADRVRLNKQLP